jgi:lipopolysaccharide/colanic/teichoic acid biosynthesis glycosyltransferase
VAIETLAESTVESPLNPVRVSRPARPVARRAAGQRRAQAPRTSGCDRPLHRPHVMSEEIFRSVLLRERRRADRFNQPFLLFLVGVEKQPDAELPALPPAVVDALGAVTRDTDVLGWFRGQSVLGLIVPEVGSAGVNLARDVEARIFKELALRIDADARRQISVGLHAHMPTTDAAEAGLASVEPIVSSLRPADEQSWRELFKRVLDVCGSGALLLILAPLFLAIAALVRLKSPGPVFFRQVRVGRRAQPFTMLKFRTMHVNNDSAIHQQYVSWFIQSSGKSQAAEGTTFKLANDPRITAIGGLLRKTSLDELPQLWNVFIGDMSLVGPRPPLAYEVEQYKPWHTRRVLEAKPGITGLWQVTGRSRTTFDEMVRLDLRYAKSHSLWTDIKILLATPRAVISGKGAC